MAQIKLPNSFFEKAKQEYSDWRWAFFRELIQNSYDAGATRIDFEIDDIQNEVNITCIDNGCGMNRNTLENVLLCMGGSQKQNKDSIGGFGYAKALLFFAHSGYQILTSGINDTDYHYVKGSGGDYEIVSNPMNCTIHGTEIQVSIKDPTNAKAFKRHLKSYVSNIFFERDVIIKLHGEVLAQDSIEYEFDVDTELGPLWFNETQSDVNTLVVAVGGLPMFKYSTYSSGLAFTGIINLVGNPFEMLTTNRDGLTLNFQSNFSALIQKLTAERTSLKIGPTLSLTLNPSKQSTGYIAIGPASNFSNEVNARMDEQQHIYQRLLDSITGKWPTDFGLRLRNVVKRKTNNEDLGVAQIQQMMNRDWVNRLAYAWHTVVGVVLTNEFLFNRGLYYIQEGKKLAWEDDWENGHHYYQNQRIDTGFIFAKGIEGMCVFPKNVDESISILMNPLLIGKDWMVGDLIDLAVHEVTHIWLPGHNEEFSTTTDEVRKSVRRLVVERDVQQHVAQVLWERNKLFIVGG